MPIKLGNDTFWVDVCQEENKTEPNSDGAAIPEDSIMLNLDMEGNTALDPNQSVSHGMYFLVLIKLKRLAGFR